jgi:hypothetical protein
MSNLIKRFVAIEIALQTQGQNNFPDQSQLRGAIIDSVVLLTPEVNSLSAVTGNSNIATLTDLQKSTVTFQRGSDAFVTNMPLLALTPFGNPSGTTPYQFKREEFFNQIIDWNQCYIRCNAAPSTANCIVSLGIYYYWPNNVQPR